MGVSWPVCFCLGGAYRLIHSSFPYRRSRRNFRRRRLRCKPPTLEVPSPRPPWHDGQAITGPKILVKVRLVGNTAFTSQQLSEITAPYTNRRLTAEDLEGLRLAIDPPIGINHGYVTSGAVIPGAGRRGRHPDDANHRGQTHGKYTSTTPSGSRSSYFQNPDQFGMGPPPLNVGRLQERLQLLQANPRVERINAELLPGTNIGEKHAQRAGEGNQSLKGLVGIQQLLSLRSSGNRGLSLSLIENLLGFRDTLNLQYGRSSGVNPC